MFWDYLSSNQESVHQVMHLFSDRGTPHSYRCMNGYSGHTYKFTKPDGSFTYVQIHLKTDQGNKTFSNDEAGAMASANPDHNTEDLFDAIEKGHFPSWTVHVQTMVIRPLPLYDHLPVGTLSSRWMANPSSRRRLGRPRTSGTPSST